MRWMLWVAAFFVLCAGVQLFVLSSHTDRFFAWTIGTPLIAAFLGAGYWAAGVLEALIARERLWANARAGVFAVWVFTTLTLVVTLLHRDILRTESIWAWAWLAVYVVVPVALGVILVLQERAPGGDPPREAPWPRWMQALCWLQVAALLPPGLVLLMQPERAADFWPWALTPLAARAGGVWLIGWSIIVLQMLRESDWRRTRIALLSGAVWGMLELVALLRYPDAVDWGAPRIWIYLAGILLVGGAGGVGAVLAWRRTAPELFARRAVEPLQPADS